MTKYLLLTAENTEEVAYKAANVLRAGGVILYPTDTLYGLGANALNREALQKIYRIKGRDEDKPIHSVFAALSVAEAYAEINDTARILAALFLPGKLTILVRKKPNVPDWATSGHDTFGVRIPNNRLCLRIARTLALPYTATSANRSGHVPERSVDKILEQLGDAAKEIDLIVDAGEISESLATTVVDVSKEKVKIVREGAIPAIEMREAIDR